MKRGLIIGFLFIFVLTTFFSLVAAYNGQYNEFDYFNFGDISISNLAQNEWVNAALLFLLIFAVCWFVLQQVFQRSPGAAFVVSFVLGLAGSFGVISYFGNIIPMIGWWVVALFLVIIFVVLWKQLRGKGITFFIILLAITLLWLMWLRPNFCPYNFPHFICVVLDSAAIIIIIVAIFKFLIGLVEWLRGHKPRWSYYEPEPREPRERRPRERRRWRLPRLRWPFRRGPRRLRGGGPPRPPRRLALPPPREINRVKRDIGRLNSAIHKGMQSKFPEDRKRVKKMLHRRNQLLKRLHQLR